MIITNTIYPIPAWASNAAVQGQQLTVTNGSAVQFATAFNYTTSVVVVDVQVANTYVTFDGSTPSTSRGHILYATQSYTWSKAAAAAAKFLATSATSSVLFASEFQV